MSPLFLVTEEQVKGLGPKFTRVMNRLLRTEIAALNLRGIDLIVTDGDTIADGGVDATVENVPAGHRWLPEGQSAWQFKSGDYGPKACEREAARASEAHKILRAGGTYVIANARHLNQKMISARRECVLSAFRGVTGLESLSPDQVWIINAEMLSSWASSRTQVVASEYFASLPDAISYEEWKSTMEDDRGTIWVEDERLAEKVDALHQLLLDQGSLAIRVEGPAGVGKSKTVLQACHGDVLPYSVVVVAGFDGVSDLLKRQISESSEDLILVVNDCSRREFAQLCDRFNFRGNFKLVGLGEASDEIIPDPIIEIQEMPRLLSEEFLKSNARSISDQQRWFVLEHFFGNPRMMLTAVQRIVRDGGREAAEIIERNDVATFINRLLPEGMDFFFAATVSLFRRVGSFRELSHQLEVLSTFVELNETEIRAAIDRLCQSEIFVRRGRYVSTSSKPLGIYLASSAWTNFGPRIVKELLPQLSGDLLGSFFERQAELGRFGPMTQSLAGVFAAGGAFTDLALIEENSLGHVLTQLAVILPDETMTHLSMLFDDSSRDDLRDLQALRRDLVWTLEKLVWHSRTFDCAADCLLRLALAENESYGNNATGIWVSLFGTFLPTTSANCDVRLEYLRSKMGSEVEVKKLVISACGRALETRSEWAPVSGELQGGSIPETRGGATTWEEAQRYWIGMIEILKDLSKDDDAGTSIDAAKVLIALIHSHIDNPWTKVSLKDALGSLREPTQVRLLRKEVEHLISLYERHDPGGRETLKLAIGNLGESLPQLNPLEEFLYLKDETRWGVGEDELRTRIGEAVSALMDSGQFSAIVGELNSPGLPAAWEIGFALGAHESESFSSVDPLVSLFEINPNALIGYLHGRMSVAGDSVFLEFVQGEHATVLSPFERALIVSRSPVAPERLEYVTKSLSTLSPVEASRVLAPWRDQLTTEALDHLIAKWTTEIRTDEEYAEILGWVSLTALVIERRGDRPTFDTSVVWELLKRRTQFHSIGQLNWDWAQLARHCVLEHHLGLAKVLISLMESGNLMIVGPDENTTLFNACMSADPEGVWGIVGEHLMGRRGVLNSELRGWLLDSTPLNTIRTWVGQDSRRAQAVSYLVRTDVDSPPEVVRYLIDEFGDSDDIKRALLNNVISGSWTGPESVRIQRQIDRFENWKSNSMLSVNTRKWAQYVLDYLRSRLGQVTEYELEQDWF